VTKHLTFSERGDGDYYASHDLEDFVTVVDGRKDIVDEVNRALPPLRAYLVKGVCDWLKTPEFIEALSGHLPADSASQQRLSLLKAKLKGIAELELADR
jgi:hypothetical protein